MRRYDDPVEVRRGMAEGSDGMGGSLGGSVGGEGAPEQFLWKGRLWKVRSVQAHWVETGPWWQSPGVHALLGHGADSAGVDSAGADGPGVSSVRTDLLAEREVWRVEAGRGGSRGDSRGGPDSLVGGVFDLVFDWSDGAWRLARCVD